jgi:hypothetical protein
LNKTLSSGNKKFNAQFNIFKWYKDINETDLNIAKQDAIIDQACKIRTELKKKKAQLTREGIILIYIKIVIIILFLRK